MAQRCATSSSSVDLPTPGSPASSVTEPGTTPPPSTRSNSLIPVWKCLVVPGSMELIGTAGDAGATARCVAGVSELSTATSLTVPQVPQSGQRPTHFAVVCWHSEQRNCERTFEPVLAMPRT
ncbi:Uncharacterised protein [Mycobacteroides abscessus subsp. abscessus]|nr:Uncharacterised protein [Mycobacteroides abscessus subsp. abscessus]